MRSSAPLHEPHWAEFFAFGRPLKLEYQWLAPERSTAPLLVFLHEGLGSLSMWRDWPRQVCDATACRGLIFSRYGYGNSTPRPLDEKWPVNFLHLQAENLYAFFSAIGLDVECDRPVLYGHSDGGSIALLYAARYPHATAGIIVAAPHIYVEDLTIENIAMVRQAYLHTDLPARLSRYHAQPDSAFFGWNDAWLNPDFRHWNIESELAAIRCPILAIQGIADEYASLEQIHGIQRHAPQTKILEITDCRHSPHKDQPAIVNHAILSFMRTLPAPLGSPSV